MKVVDEQAAPEINCSGTSVRAETVLFVCFFFSLRLVGLFKNYIPPIGFRSKEDQSRKFGHCKLSKNKQLFPDDYLHYTLKLDLLVHV